MTRGPARGRAVPPPSPPRRQAATRPGTSRRFVDDATHVAAATVARADAIVSWNFRHIVRVDKMRAYNQVNLQAGFGLLSIVSPQEVRFDEDD